MNPFKTKCKTIGVLLTVVLLLVSTCFQTASAAMIGTEKLLRTTDNSVAVNNWHISVVRQAVRDALIARGIEPQEAQLRVESLTDHEIEMILSHIDELAAGKGVIIFSMIVVAVTIATVLIFTFTSITDVFP